MILSNPVKDFKAFLRYSSWWKTSHPLSNRHFFTTDYPPKLFFKSSWLLTRGMMKSEAVALLLKVKPNVRIQYSSYTKKISTSKERCNWCINNKVKILCLSEEREHSRLAFTRAHAKSVNFCMEESLYTFSTEIGLFRSIPNYKECGNSGQLLRPLKK